MIENRPGVAGVRGGQREAVEVDSEREIWELVDSDHISVYTGQNSSNCILYMVGFYYMAISISIKLTFKMESY